MMGVKPMHRPAAFLLVILFMTGCTSHRLDEDEIVYMAVGASDAVGIGATPITNGYVFRIEDALEEEVKNVHLLNIGIPGADLDAIAKAAKTTLRLGAHPDLVTIWVGANDVIDGVDPDDFEADLDDLLDRLENNDTFIVIADLPDLTQLPRFREEPRETVTLGVSMRSIRSFMTKPRSMMRPWCDCRRKPSKSAMSATPTAFIPLTVAISV
jgi:hypothetical protein